MTTIEIPISLFSEALIDDEIIVTIEGYMHPEDKASEFSPPSDAYMEILPYKYKFPLTWDINMWRHMSLVLKKRLDNDKNSLVKMLIKQYEIDKEADEEAIAERRIEEREE